MSRNKKDYLPKKFEATKSGAFTRIYNELFDSEACRSLSKPQLVLLFRMYQQLYGSKNHPFGEDTFYFNHYLWDDTYKLYKNSSSFEKDRNELINKGFIRIASDTEGRKCDGKNTRTKTVYQYSHKWQLYGTEKFKIELSEKPQSLINKETLTES